MCTGGASGATEHMLVEVGFELSYPVSRVSKGSKLRYLVSRSVAGLRTNSAR